MEPIRAAIEEKLNSSGQKYQISMRIFTTYEEAISAAASGKADFSRLGPASYVEAKKRNPGLQLLAMESKSGTGFLTGYIYVPEDSSIHELKDLRGHRIAFGEENSTTGRYIPQALLVNAGLKAKDFAEYKYLGRHDKVAFAVGTGAFDAGASNEISYGKYTATKKLRAILSFQGRTHAWAAHSKLPASIRHHLQTVLLQLKSDELTRIGRDGFLPAKDSDYNEIRKTMKLAERFTE
jgi:phosphonate transport system substrate-binding protein